MLTAMRVQPLRAYVQGTGHGLCHIVLSLDGFQELHTCRWVLLDPACGLSWMPYATIGSPRSDHLTCSELQVFDLHVSKLVD